MSRRIDRLVCSDFVSASASISRIVSWEVLPGLPGEGPVPLHFHAGHPTPWAEGLVIRFWSDDGSEWVGNFQGHRSREIVLWREADAVVVVAMENLYVVDARNPEHYVTVPSDEFGKIMFDPEHRFLFVPANTTIYAIGQDRRVAWTHQITRGFYAELLECANDVLTVGVEEEMGGAVRTFRLSTMDGSVLYDPASTVTRKRTFLDSVRGWLSRL